MIRSQIATSRTEVVSEGGVVACGHIQEAEAGARMLEEGGNAVDAVVAAAFTGHVVEPANCGLGGYGHMALFLAETRQLVSVDHSVRAPAAARPDMYEVDPSQPTTYYGWPPTVDRQNEWGAISMAVPGAVSGLCAAHERWGRLPLGQVLEPAIEAAENGVDITWDLVLAIVGRLKEIESLPGAAALLLPQRPATKDPRRWRPSRRERRANRHLTTRQDSARDRPPRSRRLLPRLGRRVDRTRGEGRRRHPHSRRPRRLPAEDHRRSRSVVPRHPLLHGQRSRRLRGAEHPGLLRPSRLRA